jgi:drug/metabolite transporter (DMT)-like permease
LAIFPAQHRVSNLFVSRQHLAQALIFFTPVLWCVNYLVARWAPGVIEPHALAFGRWLVAAGLLATVSGAELWAHRALLRQRVWQLLVLGALGMWVCGAWVYIAAQTTTATNIALIYAASPVVITLLSIVWLQERFGRWQALGVAIALSGVVHVIIKGQWAALSAVHWVVGDLWIVAAMVAWALFAVLQRRWPMPLSAAAHLCAMGLAGLVVLLPFTVSWPSLGIHHWAGRLQGWCWWLGCFRVRRPSGVMRLCSASWVWRGRRPSCIWGRCMGQPWPGRCWVSRWAGITRWALH